jgi:pyridoxal phosphate enzyme (YggS family)
MQSWIASVGEQVAEVRRRLVAAEQAAGRPPGSVRLLAATKTLTVPQALAAVEVGLDLVGESRVQELVVKGPAWAQCPTPPTVHFIGVLQSNKIARTIPLVDCVQSVATTRLAAGLSRRAKTPLDVMVQVNTSGETTKSGVAPVDAVEFALQVAELPNLRLAGFMTIGPNTDDEAVIAAAYNRLRQIRDDVVASGAPGTQEATELSMGMTNDLEIAVAAGATMVRVGTALFGARD